MTSPAKKATPAKKAPAREMPAEAETPQRTDAEAAPGAAEEEEPLNRAERRAKGRGKSISALPVGRGKLATGGHGPAHTQRNWANRRSG